MPENDTVILDVEATLERLKGDKAFLHTLFGVFLEDLPQKLIALNNAAREGNQEDILRTAHSLKGASATIGAPALRDAANTIETATRNGDTATAAVGIASLDEVAQELLARLREEIAKG